MSVAETRKQWVVLCDPEIFGLVSAYEIMRGMTEGTIKDDDCVWKKGWTQWKLIKTIPIFSHTCGRSPGSGRAVPDIPVPGSEAFGHIVSPRVPPERCHPPGRAAGLRAAFVIGASLIGGVPGAAFASCLAKRERITADVLHDPEMLAVIFGNMADS